MGSFFDPVDVESGVTEMNKTSWKGGGTVKILRVLVKI